MTMDSVLEHVALPLLLTAVCFYFVVKLWVFKDTYAIRNKQTRKLRNAKVEEAYRHDAGWLILFFSFVSIGNAVISLFDPLIAIIEMIVGFMIIAIFWKNMEEKYSAPGTESAVQMKPKNKNKNKKKK